MNNNFLISRRALAGGALVLGLGRKAALAQGFAGLGMSGQGFAPVTPGKTFSFRPIMVRIRTFASSGGT